MVLPDAQPDSEKKLLSGSRIRDARRRANLTLQQLSDLAGISVGFLSLVERDKATPSLGTLAQLAGALEVSIEYFIATPKVTDSYTRANERSRFAVADSSLQYEKLSTDLPGGTLTSLIIHIPAGYASELTSHPGEEMIVVLEGEVQQVLGEGSFAMQVGDSLHFMGDVPHSFANTGDSGARILWTGTTPRLRGPKQTPLKRES
ncbi:cupin domain-containing protein [Saccharospirillum sp. HFRX-1]|uniref:helix-turn-helix domain-containing protein n=1 Tax=unclassified Saccharospirillum TaxID=2633430 RepID=UPI003713B759